MKSKFSYVILGLQVLSLLFCVLCCIYTLVMGAGEGIQRGSAIMCLGALVATAYYVLRGQKKSVAKAYKVMLLFCAAASIMCIVPHIYDTDLLSSMPNAVAIVIIGYAVCFGLFLILALVPDLGKVRTNVIILIIFCIYFATAIFFQIKQPGLLAGGTRAGTIGIMRLTCMYWLAVNVGTCCYFKYQDKATRGSK